jgi:hypothetical protein
MDSRVVVRNRSIQSKIFTAKTPSSQRVHREKQGFPGISLGNSLLSLRELGVLAVKFFDLVHHPGIHHEPPRIAESRTNLLDLVRDTQCFRIQLETVMMLFWLSAKTEKGTKSR